MATKTFIGFTADSTDGTSHLFSNVAIGTYSADAKLLICATHSYATETLFTSPIALTMDGVSIPLTRQAKLVNSAHNTTVGWALIDHPGAGITDADFELFAAASREGWSIAVWLLEGSSEWAMHYHNWFAVTATTGSVSLNHSAGDFLFACSTAGRTIDRFITVGSAGAAGGAGPTTITGGRDTFTVGVARDGGGTVDTNTGLGSRYSVDAISLTPLSAIDGDAFYGSVVLLLSCDGLEGTNTFVDSSPSAKTITVGNQASMNNLEARMGLGCATFDGNNDSINSADSIDWQLGATSADPWTVEGWVRPVSATGTYLLIGQQGTPDAWRLRLNVGVLTFDAYNGSTTWTLADSIARFTAATWAFVAVDKDATGKVRIYFNGTMVASSTPANSAIADLAQTLRLGLDFASGNDFSGQMDDIRVTKGIARYASDSGHTVPQYPFPNFIGSITKNLILDYAIGISKDLILDYEISALVTKDLILDYSIQLTKDLTLDYAIPSLTTEYYDYNLIDGSTGLVEEFSFEASAGPIDFVLVGTMADAPPPDHVIGDDIEGVLIEHFYYDFYYRIWLDPTIRNLSNPRIGTPVPFNVWSAFPYANELFEVIAVDLPGVSLDFTLPVAFIPYEYKTLSFTITSDAPATLDGLFDLVFTHGEAELRVIATIIAILKAIPNDPITESWLWNTTLNISKGGKEQRTALRAQPRYRLNFPTFLDGETGRRAHYNQLWAFMSRNIRVPFFQYRTSLLASAALGETKLLFDPLTTDLRDGEYLALFNALNGELKLVECETVDVDGCTLVSPLDEDIGLNWSVIPTIDMRMAEGSGLAMDAINGSAVVVVESTQKRDLSRAISTATITTFDGLPVIHEKPIAQNEVDEMFSQNTETIDNGSSLPSLYTFWDTAFVSGAREYLFDRDEDIDYWRDLFTEINGRQNSFLLPTWREDLVPVEAPVLGSSVINIEVTEFIEQNENATYDRVQIATQNGVIYRSVASVIDTGLGYAELTLNSGIGSNPGDNIIESISFLNLCRLDNDEVSIAHYRNYSIISFDVRTINE
jgi:hypothetical protein